MNATRAQPKDDQQRDFSRVFVPGANRFELLRHVFASMVLFDHAFVLGGFGHALRDTPVRYSIGHLGVACFFILSGGLVAASHDRCASSWQFFRNRALRILPAYWVCLIVAACLIAPLNAALGAASFDAFARAYAEGSGPVGYVLKNAALIQLQPGIGHLFANNPEPGALNGSLWSIPWEAGCYLFVAALGASAGLARRRALVPLALLAALANCWLAPPGSILGLYYLSARVVVLPVYFLLGMSFYLFRMHLPRRHALCVLALVGFAATSLVDAALPAVFLAYVIFFAAGRSGDATRVRATTDISYGLYIYGFPIQQTLFHFGVHKHGVSWMLGASVLLAIPLALLSWKLIEAPALALKGRASRAVGPATQDPAASPSAG